jgi:PRTRC genetic system protein E
MAFGIADGSSWFRGPIPTFKEGRRVNTVFTELMPLLRQRAVMITISDVGQGLLRVNIIPRKLVVDGSSDENTALTTPLSITGKAEELDRELPGQLATFTESIARTGSNLDELKTQHAAAVKALEAENKKKLDDKKKGNGSKTASTPPNPNPPTEFKDGKPVFGSKTAPPTGENRSLFDTATDQADADLVEQPAEDDATAPPPQHPSASASSYPD